MLANRCNINLAIAGRTRSGRGREQFFKVIVGSMNMEYDILGYLTLPGIELTTSQVRLTEILMSSAEKIK